MRTLHSHDWRAPPRRYGPIEPIDESVEDPAWLRSWRFKCGAGCSICAGIVWGVFVSIMILDSLAGHLR
jgi:hypothetical protein